MDPHRSRSSVWLGRLGALLVVTGLVIGGYVAWQVWGTSVVAQRTHRALVQDVERAWERSSGDADTGAAAGAGAPGLATEHGRVSAVVRIPRFGDDYAVPLLEGTSEEVLEAGFGRFVQGADPGGAGNFAVAAHRVTHGEPLRDMPSLQPGDEVVVETARWRYTYVLDSGGDDLTVTFRDTWVLDDLPRHPEGGVEPPPDVGRRLLTLTTCSELFHTDDRLVAFGHLASVQRVRR